jgi:hypothetical protein
MAGYRVVRVPFVADGALFGPGRYPWGATTDWWRISNSEPTDDASIPPGHAETIGIDGLARAFDRLAVWQRLHAA